MAKNQSNKDQRRAKALKAKKSQQDTTSEV